MWTDKKINNEYRTFSEPVVTVKNLVVEFRSRTGNVQAVDGVTFSLHQAETLVILVDSGSRKSTVALALMGLLPKPNGHINSGSIHFEGKNLLEVREAERR